MDGLPEWLLPAMSVCQHGKARARSDSRGRNSDCRVPARVSALVNVALVHLRKERRAAAWLRTARKVPAAFHQWSQN